MFLRCWEELLHPIALQSIYGSRSAIQNCSAATAAFHMEYPLANSQKSVASIMKNLPEVS